MISFGEGLVRVLFATETFAMGINMPAKTVIFTACRKFDGTDFRWMQSGEYIQMSGRAGRRGLDDRGIVVQILDEKMEPEVCRAILKGTAEPLLSTFHLGYNMLLNALRMEDFEPTKLIKGSFYQFQQLVGLPEKRKVAELAEAEADAIVVANEDEVDDYWRITEQLARAEANARRIVSTPEHLMPFLQAGRLVRVSGQQWNAHGATAGSAGGAGDGAAEGTARSVDDGCTDWGWGTVVSCSKLPKSGGDAVGGGAAGESRTIVDVLLHVKQGVKAEDGSDADAPATYEPCALNAPKSEGGQMKVLPVVLQMINQVSAIRIYLPSDLTLRKNRNNVWISLTEVFNRFEKHEDSTGKGYVPLLDPIRDMGITDAELETQVGRAKSLYSRLQASPMHGAADRDARFAAFSRRKALRAMAAKVRRDVQDTETGDMHDTLKRMCAVLRRLGACRAPAVSAPVVVSAPAASPPPPSSVLFATAAQQRSCMRGVLTCARSPHAASLCPLSFSLPFPPLSSPSRRAYQQRQHCAPEGVHGVRAFDGRRAPTD